MNVARQRTLNVLAGIVFSLLGVGAYAAAVYLIKVPPEPVLGSHSTEIDVKACTQLLTRLGFQHSKLKTELRVEKKGDLADAERMMSDASIAIAGCGLKITRFCLGTGCQAPAIPDGIFFALSTQVAVEDLMGQVATK